MPNDIKAAVSVLALVVAFAYASWEWMTGRPDLAWVVIATGIFAVVSMWIFPEAVSTKKNDKQKNI
jgi:hypothetical protein